MLDDALVESFPKETITVQEKFSPDYQLISYQLDAQLDEYIVLL